VLYPFRALLWRALSPLTQVTSMTAILAFALAVVAIASHGYTAAAAVETGLVAYGAVLALAARLWRINPLHVAVATVALVAALVAAVVNHQGGTR
jgi:hypothetical protein